MSTSVDHLKQCSQWLYKQERRRLLSKGTFKHPSGRGKPLATKSKNKMEKGHTEEVMVMMVLT